MLVRFLAIFTVDTEATIGLQDFAASSCSLFTNIKDGTLLPADVVMHIDKISAFTHCTKVIASPLIIVLRLSLELSDILRPNWLSMVVVLRKLWEDDVHHLAFNTFHSSLHPTLNLLNLFIAIDPNIDIVTWLQLLPPNLILCRHFLQILIGHLKISLMQHIVRLEGPGHGTCKVLVISFVFHLMAEEVHKGAHRVRCRLDILPETRICARTSFAKQ